ncbi:MAG: twin-arginine translocase subunit TatC [Actinomycetota bacterium]|nr:twin-arginine translocase subunit TatC [Actinomycetota bacterium]
MATALRRPVSHDEHLSLVEHLDELRSRLIVCVLALVVCFGVTFWQNETVLDIVNAPLEDTQNLDGEKRSNDPLEQNARFQIREGEAARANQAAARSQRLAIEGQLADPDLSARERRLLESARDGWLAAERANARAAEAVPTNRERQPVTLGVAEPFTTTMSVAFYAALLLALPLILYQAYAFVIPAFEPGERRIAVPLLLMVPFLFLGGVAFGYFVVLPRAVEFLQNFNDDDFDILIQARDYYKFSIMFLAGIGVLFQIPVGVLIVTRLGIVTPRQLQSNFGYVVLAVAVLAAVATPTPDPITMTLAMLPLLVLFELSILVAAWVNRVSPPGSLWGDDDEDDEVADPYAHTDED